MTQSGELLIVGFEGTRAPEDLLRRIADRRVGGVVLFARNLGTLDEVAALNQALHAAVPEGDPPLLVSLDQEGGRVQRIKAPYPHWPPMAKVGARDLAQLTRQVGAHMGKELWALGFNMNWAPVLDVDSNPANPVIGDRAFGKDPAVVARHALEYWMGLESALVRGCGKHFPGHGDTATDSHHTLPVVDKSLDELRRVELAPFAEACLAGVPMMMTAHVVYPAVDEKPATMSRRWLTEILRGELGFRGAVVSDDLDMKAVAAHFPVEKVVVESLMAGCDCFLACRDAAVQQKAEDALARAAADDAAVRARLADALSRFRALRATLEAPPPADSWRQLDLDAHHALFTSV
jgi:beta-N-acetylhexosaminidase